MGRTAINVTGNCLASVVVAQWEGKFCDEIIFGSKNSPASFQLPPEEQ